MQYSLVLRRLGQLLRQVGENPSQEEVVIYDFVSLSILVLSFCLESNIRHIFPITVSHFYTSLTTMRIIIDCKSFWYFLSRCRLWQTKQTKRAQAISSENCVFQISPLLAKIDTRSKLATFFFNTRLLLCLEILESNVYVTDIWHRVWSIFRFYKIEISLSAKYPAVYFLLPKGFLLSWI